MMDAECTGDLVVPTAKSSERCAVWAGTMVCIPEQKKDNHKSWCHNQSDVMGPILSLFSLSPLLPTSQSSSPNPPSPSSCFFPSSLLPPLPHTLHFSPTPRKLILVQSFQLLAATWNILLGNVMLTELN